jgi:signal transduction histidine kinase
LIKTFTDGEEAVLSIKDQGTGIEPKILERIGTPFFTTKEQGTGLGLATCYRIAERNNARIEVDTSSTGTTFFVRFKTSA